MAVFHRQESLKKLHEQKREKAAVKAAVETLENALCEMDNANAERMAAIEDALCEIDGGTI